MDSKIEKSKKVQQNGTEEEGIPEEEIQLGALLKYFGTPSATSQDEKPSTSAIIEAEEPSTSSASHMSPQMQSDPEDEDPFASTSPRQDSSECFGARHTLALLGFLAIVSMFNTKVSLSVAIVAMVNSTRESNELEDDSCPYPGGSNPEDGGYSNGEFDWNEKTQGIVLGSLFYGYALTNVLGGRAAEYWGGRVVVGLGVVFSAFFTILSPLAARSSTTLFIIVRVLAGCCGGVTTPALNTLIAKWYPKNERSKFASAIFAGVSFGTVATMLTTGWLCASDFLGGWPSAFYVPGILGVIWGVFWFWLIRDNPKEHPRISHAELTYIMKGVPETKESLPVPWISIFTSGPFWVIAIMHFGHSWGFFTILTELPTYLDQIQHIAISNNGMLSSLPYFGSWLFNIIFSLITDQLITREHLSIISVRKISMVIGGYGPMLGLIVMCFVNCHWVWALVVLVISGTFSGSIYCGYMSSHADISPRYAGTLMGLTNTLAAVSGFVTPSVAGALTQDNQTLWAWRIVFLISVLVYAITVTIYVVFVTTEVQPWNDPKPKK